MDKIHILLQANYNKFMFDSFPITLILLLMLILVIVISMNKINRKINKDLYYKEELIKTIGSNKENVFWIYDEVLKEFEYVSSNFEKTLELNVKALERGGKDMLNYLPLEVKEKVSNMLLLNNGYKVLEEVIEYIKPVTKCRSWVMLRIYPIYKSKKVVRYICIATDITNEKMTQIALEEALLKLQNANNAKKEFLSHMSHELKTPISAINGIVSIASNSLEDIDKIKYCLENIAFLSNKVMAIINNVLEMSRLDCNKLILEQEPFRLSQVLNSFSSIMKEQALLHQQKYSFSMQDIQNDYLIGDSLRLMQILANCISNSIKFTPPKGKITLEVSEIKKKEPRAIYKFIVSDTGKGMNEEFLKRLFDPFEQEDRAISKKHGGTGIGMTITKELVKLMDGDIHVTSELNIGTIITIHIPFIINMNKSEQENIITSGFDHYDCKGKRVLVVEDNDINREVTYELLKNMNLNVETASNGYEVIKLFETSDSGYYDVILMDIQMPDLDGYETAKLIRKSSHPDAKSVFIMTLTADDLLDKQESYECGINYHMSKPIDIECFYTLLQNINIKRESND